MFILSASERFSTVQSCVRKKFSSDHLQIQADGIEYVWTVGKVWTVWTVKMNSKYEKYEQYEQDQMSAIRRRKMLTHLKSFKTLGV